MGKKILAIVLIAAFCVTLLPPPVSAASPDPTPLEKIGAVEMILYGAEQDGSLLDRTVKLERDLFGQPSRDALMSKISRIYEYARVSSAGAPSLALKMSSLEWSLTQNVAKGPVKSRLDNLEKTLYGKSGSGSVERVL